MKSHGKEAWKMGNLKNEAVYFYQAPFGRLTLASDGDNITGLWIDGQKYDRATLEQPYRVCGQEIAVFAKAQQWLDIYFSGREPGFMLPLKPKGSAFRQEVWELLQKVPYGQTTTYKEIAGEIAARRGKQTTYAQAVGSAIGHNPISILIPCHRVLGADGSLTGYAGGISVKEYLLKLEGIKNIRLCGWMS